MYAAEDFEENFENFEENHWKPRKDKMWWDIWALLEECTKQSSQTTIVPPMLPRKRRAPPRNEEGLEENTAAEFERYINIL